jgi:hypothetical protein
MDRALKCLDNVIGQKKLVFEVLLEIKGITSDLEWQLFSSACRG